MRLFVSLFFAALNLTLLAFPSSTQEPGNDSQGKNDIRVRVETPGALYLWDDSRNELTIGESHQGNQPTPLVNIYNVLSGEKRSLDVAKEFPHARSVYIEGLAGGPDGSVLVTCEVESDDGVFAGDRLLVYDGQSSLTTSLVTAGYDVGATALDKKGNIYFAGLHDNENSSKESYPLLVKYDSYGYIAKEMLPRSLFASVDDPVGDALGDPHTGATRVVAGENAVRVYLAPVSEMIVLNGEGKIQSRTNVANKLSEFAKAKRYKTVYVEWDEFSPSGDLWLVGHLEEPSDSASAMLAARNFVVRLTPKGQLQVPYKGVGDEAPGHYLPKLIGFTQSGEPVGSSSRGSDFLLVQKQPY
jgi:hypothetical protein